MSPSSSFNWNKIILSGYSWEVLDNRESIIYKKPSGTQRANMNNSGKVIVTYNKNKSKSLQYFTNFSFFL